MRHSSLSMRLTILLVVWLTACIAGAAPYVVTSTADSGPGTLREAITAANTGGVSTAIGFDITGGCATVCTITLASPLPAVAVPITLDGYTQTGASANTLAVGDDAVFKIVVDASGVLGDTWSITPIAPGTLVRGLVFHQATLLVMADGAVFEGNFIGIDAGGTVADNQNGRLRIEGGNDIRIGGTSPAQRNVFGVAVEIRAAGSGTLIQGNYMGTTRSGMAASGTGPFPGYIAVQAVLGSVGAVTIGGTAAGAGNVICSGFNNGIWIDVENPILFVGAVTIQGNYIGVNAAGTAAIPNFERGILLSQVAGSIGPVLIGGTAPGARNVISGNGVFADGSDAGIESEHVLDLTIQGNYIGTDASGLLPIAGHQNGIRVLGDGTFTQTNRIGGTALGSGNVISSNQFAGIQVIGTLATIEGNFIGAAADGNTPLGNGWGIEVLDGQASIGGTTAAQRNVVAFGAGKGIIVHESSGSARAAILGNSIHDNGQIGIDLTGSGTLLPNDALDADTGASGLQNYPVLTFAAAGTNSVTLSGVLDSAPNQNYRLEFFANTACNVSGSGEGNVFLGTMQVSTDAVGHASFTTPTFTTPGFTVFTATATDNSGNTSEFSPCLSPPGPAVSFYTVTPCRIVDTRNAPGPYGGPSLAANTDRSFVIAGQCGVPVGAKAVALNLTATQSFYAGDIRVVPGGSAFGLVSALNWGAGKTRANNAVIALGPIGDIIVHVDLPQQSAVVDLIVDVAGYFQ